ncbi:hypothetical protein CTAYLR_006720 [Chrysophaeum taylorii]|uniref:JmjC domain-containing protein n=1 Tax=Chrysophaeum taylorii TaxID=2483200 RepID=A0AAD7XJC0_9STRA|nr:hypothetical protein CTAYLR_006720 [Chrysophaeum taylorii]
MERTTTEWECGGLVTRWVSPEADLSRWSVEAISERAGDLVVEAQVSRNGVFPGEEALRRSVRVQLATALNTTTTTTTTTANEKRGLYYVAQAPVARREASGRIHPLALWPLFGELGFPPIRGNAAELNAWINADAATTPAHFDERDNLLSVLAGRKRVALAPHASVEAKPCWGGAPNHAAGPMAPRRVVDVAAGEALFVPRGVWHEVWSEPGTVALNAWFEVPRGGRRSADAAAFQARMRVVRAVNRETRSALRRTRAVQRLVPYAASSQKWRFFLKHRAPKSPALAAALWLLADKVDVFQALKSAATRDRLKPRVRRARDAFARACLAAVINRHHKRNVQ